MVLGIGVDIMKIDQLNIDYLTADDPFVRNCYTKNEYEQAILRENPLYYFATRFAGKEAVYKALHWKGNHIRFREIEILNQEDGQPIVYLHGKVRDHAEREGIEEILISLSYDSEYAVGYAMAQNKS